MSSLQGRVSKKLDKWSNSVVPASDSSLTLHTRPRDCNAKSSTQKENVHFMRRWLTKSAKTRYTHGHLHQAHANVHILTHTSTDTDEPAKQTPSMVTEHGSISSR